MGGSTVGMKFPTVGLRVVCAYGGDECTAGRQQASEGSEGVGGEGGWEGCERTTFHGPSGMSTGAAGISDAPSPARTRRALLR